jgi:hypothetical protein
MNDAVGRPTFVIFDASLCCRSSQLYI